MECFFDFGFLFGTDVVFFGEFGLARSRLFGCWGGGGAYAFLWGLFTLDPLLFLSVEVSWTYHFTELGWCSGEEAVAVMKLGGGCATI